MQYNILLICLLVNGEALANTKTNKTFCEQHLAEQHADWDSPFKFNSKELDSETGLYYYGARYYDPKTSVFIGVDKMAGKHPNFSPYTYCAYNPIILIDSDDKDWSYSTNNVDGKTHINLTFVGAIMNSSGKPIDMKKLIANEVKKFESVFGQGNVNATILLREVKSNDELKWNETLIELKSGNNFKPNEGGNTKLGAKYININADFIDKNGNFSDKKTMVHEIGHTGGLVHPWEFDQKHIFINGNSAPTDNQAYSNSSNSSEVESNFLNYTDKAVDNFYNPCSNMDLIKYFNENVGKATEGQVQQIINNIFNGNLNYDNIPKD